MDGARGGGSASGAGWRWGEPPAGPGQMAEVGLTEEDDVARGGLGEREGHDRVCKVGEQVERLNKGPSVATCAVRRLNKPEEEAPSARRRRRHREPDTDTASARAGEQPAGLVLWWRGVARWACSALACASRSVTTANVAREDLVCDPPARAFSPHCRQHVPPAPRVSGREFEPRNCNVNVPASKPDRRIKGKR